MSKQNKKGQCIDKESVDSGSQSVGGQCAAETEDRTTDIVAEDGASEGDSLSHAAVEAAEWRDKYVRLSAEFDNYRKRTLREKMDLVAAGGEDVVRGLLNVLDDIDRAMTALEGAREIEAVKEGVVLIRQKIDDVLKSKRVSEIEAIGLPLDTDVHEAVAKFPVGEEERRGRIIDVVQKGYKMGDKVVRHAKVVVGE